MLVKSVVCKLTDLPPICIGSFPSTNNRSLRLLNQIWNIFRQRPLIFLLQSPCCTHTAAAITALWRKPMASHLADVQASQGVLGNATKTKPKGSLTHVAVNKFFISSKDAHAPKQPSTCHFTNITPQVLKQSLSVNSRI